MANIANILESINDRNLDLVKKTDQVYDEVRSVIESLPIINQKGETRYLGFFEANCTDNEVRFRYTSTPTIVSSRGAKITGKDVIRHLMLLGKTEEFTKYLYGTVLPAYLSKWHMHTVPPFKF